MDDPGGGDGDGRKTMPAWGKVNRIVPNLAVTGADMAAQQGLAQDLSGVVERGAAQAQPQENPTPAPSR